MTVCKWRLALGLPVSSCRHRPAEALRLIDNSTPRVGRHSGLHCVFQNEEAALRAARTRGDDGAAGPPAWNHAEFAVPYPSLAKHLAIGGVYLKLLLDGADPVRFRSRVCVLAELLQSFDSFDSHHQGS